MQTPQTAGHYSPPAQRRKTVMEPATTALEFSLTREEKPVKIDGQSYTLVEMDGKDRDTYLTKLGERLRHGADGKATGIKNFDALHATLIALCLRSADGKAVPINTIQTWPARVVTALYDAAMEMNNLGDEKEDAEPGND